MLSFEDVLVSPYTALFEMGKGSHRGGPHWPDWDRQTVARHNNGGKVIDDPPEAVPSEPVEIAEPVAWAGPTIRHYGHQLADFSMRLFPTLVAWPSARFVFGTHPQRSILSLDDAPPAHAFLGQILDWYDIPRERVRILREPAIARRLLVAGQAEQLPDGPCASQDHLAALDGHAKAKLGPVQRAGTVFVSRAGTYRPLAGEAYLESLLRIADVEVFRPETSTVTEQVCRYRSAERLVFSEGSALHTLQLLGNQDVDVLVLGRGRGRRLAEGLLRPRLRSLRYAEVGRGIVSGTDAEGVPAPWFGLGVPDARATVDALASFGIDIRASWDERVFAAARDDDVRRWMRTSRHSADARPKEWRPAVAASLDAVGLGHLVREVPDVHEEATGPVGLAGSGPGPSRRLGTMSGDTEPEGSAGPQPGPQGSGAPIGQPWSPRRLGRLAAALGASSYLEVGVARGETFREVPIPRRTGVDPRFGFDITELADDDTVLVEASSDDFFRTLAPDRTFDVIFLDGLHTFEQTYRDLCNSLLHVHRGSVILLDDTLPADPWSAVPDVVRSLRLRRLAGRTDTAWHGDVYKVVAAIHSFHPALDYRTIVGSGNGQTLVWRGPRVGPRPAPLSIDEIGRMSYFDLLDRRELLCETSEDAAIAACIGAVTGGSDRQPV